jgi:hypothetical protein
MKSQLKFEIMDLRQQNVQHLLEAVAAIMASLVVASLLPSLLVQFVYTDQAALMSGQTPFWLQNGSMIIFGLGMLYALAVAVTTITRSRRIGMLKRQLAMIAAEPAFSDDEVAAQEKELAELEKMVDEALAESPKDKKPAAKKATKKSKK